MTCGEGTKQNEQKQCVPKASQQSSGSNTGAVSNLSPSAAALFAKVQSATAVNEMIVCRQVKCDCETACTRPSRCRSYENCGSNAIKGVDTATDGGKIIGWDTNTYGHQYCRSACRDNHLLMNYYFHPDWCNRTSTSGFLITAPDVGE